ncbi:MAG: LTA synthase family protein [Tenericutes bacterium]|nr:LTA synthase family protein [Mycoplasmatota bacterium]
MKIKKILSKIKISKKDLLDNKLFFLTLISALINDFLLRAFTIGNILNLKPFFGTFGFILLLCSFGFLLENKKRNIYYSIILILSIIITVANSIYYTFYSSFLSVSLISIMFQLSDVKDAIKDSVFQYKDLIYIWPSFVLCLLLRDKKNKENKINKKTFYSCMSLSTFVLVSYILIFGVNINSLSEQWSKEYIVSKFGIYIYQANDIIRSFEPNINNMFGCEQSIRKVEAYYEERDNKKINNEFTNIFKGKNLIAIHAESIQQFLLDLEFNGVEVTPNLNKLSKEGIYFSNFYSQVGVGTSSDTEFTLSTSLLPVKSGTIFVSYWDREYKTLPKMLNEKGYYSFSMHGNIGTFWNRIVMHEKLGYNKFFHESYYELDENIGLGLSDKSFFRQSIPLIKEISLNNANFYANMITLSNHTPFMELEKYGEFDLSMEIEVENEYGELEKRTVPYLENNKLGNYIKSSHYADSAIGEFIKGLDEAGLLEDTVLLIYGDHDARLLKNEYDRFYNYNPLSDSILDKNDPNYKEFDYYSYELNRKVPLIIWTKNNSFKKEVKTVMGMVDVLPTLGNMFDFYNEYSLGNDIFNLKENIVVFQNGNWLTDKMYYNNQKEEYLPLEKEVISDDYITMNKEKAEELLNISNDIVVCDYIKKTKDISEANK